MIDSKTVTFAAEPTYLETYSSDEYDRSGIFSTPVLYKVNPSLNKPSLSLNIVQQPELEFEETSSAESSPDTPSDHFPIIQHTPTPKKKKLRPILSVDTSVCADPLFFTGLSTNYAKRNDFPTDNDYLVPISATY
ncbi:hypothetical protein K501DRAFT_196534 [Backusella circina FSU 941]|nr:hypothetical protein K501DRAFT_196534 [Backusella circina FSU 941]